MESLCGMKRVRDDSEELESESPVVKRLRDDLLGFSEESVDFCASSQDLDSFVKGFEDEISARSSPADAVVDLTSESGESRPKLDYLYEASDDDLGLAPSKTSPAEFKIHVEDEVASVWPGLGETSELWSLDDQISCYNSIDVGICFDNAGATDDYLALDALFDYADQSFGSADGLHPNRICNDLC